MCVLMASRGRQANPVLTYETALRRFLGWRIMKPLFGVFFWLSYYETALRRFYFGATAENDNFMAKMEKCCFLFAKNDYLIGITSIFSLK